MLAFLRNSLVFLSLILFGSTVMVKAPEYHEMALRFYVGPKVIKISPPYAPDSGGTGFLLETMKGTLVITNRHICEMLPNKLGVGRINDSDTPRALRVVKMDDQSDLCALDGYSELSGLSLGETPSQGQTIYVLGHPALNPQTLRSGSINIIKVIDFVIPEKSMFNVQACNGKDEMLRTENGISICIRLQNGYLTDIQIVGGNSGSPVVDRFGKVVSVVFAANTATNNGIFVVFEDLKRFILSVEKVAD